MYGYIRLRNTNDFACFELAPYFGTNCLGQLISFGRGKDIKLFISIDFVAIEITEDKPV
jgi:hypothetical protein